MDFVCSSFIHRGCTAQTYQIESIIDDQVGCELPGVIPDLDNQETKKKKEQIDSLPKLCPPLVQRTLFLNNESPETSTKPNGMDDPDRKEVTYKSKCVMMTKVFFDVFPKVLPQEIVKDVLPNEGMRKKILLSTKDKTEEVDNKDSEAAKPDGHASKVNECADKKVKHEEVDNKDSEA
ncbi:hypothetical protein LWI28_021835 [Acer negundo]|uniref:Uncharacterized protein n=1 Tax=Acer negundo TaxID=4023 RepID=A0AAD5IR60_ACENE|nr:hypothetical protein LWI28_021835 [Acer negundo]